MLHIFAWFAVAHSSFLVQLLVHLGESGTLSFVFVGIFVSVYLYIFITAYKETCKYL